MHTTSVSLLERMRQPSEEAAWDRFVVLYTPLLCHWARRLGLHASDADDLVQDVFVILLREMPRFHYQPSMRFRGWLWSVLRNRWRENLRRRPALPAGEGVLADLAGPDEFEAISEAEYQQYLTHRVAQMIQDQFQPTTWKAFWECVVLDRPAAAVAADLGISENAVYIARCRVLRRLRQELDGLMD